MSLNQIRRKRQELQLLRSSISAVRAHLDMRIIPQWLTVIEAQQWEPIEAILIAYRDHMTGLEAVLERELGVASDTAKMQGQEGRAWSWLDSISKGTKRYHIGSRLSCRTDELPRFTSEALVERWKGTMDEWNRKLDQSPTVQEVPARLATPCGKYKVFPLTNNILFIGTERPEVPTAVLKGLAHGLSFVPSRPTPEEVGSTINDFVRRYAWKLLLPTQICGEQVRFVPSRLRQNLPRPMPSNLTEVDGLLRSVHRAYKAAENSRRPDSISEEKVSRQVGFAALWLRRRKGAIVAKGADKGGSLVLMANSFYRETVNHFLSDRDYFELLSADPTVQTTQAVTDFLGRMTKKRVITDKLNKMLRPSVGARCPFLYGLPKVHKEPVSIRPIVSGNEHPTEFVSIYIDHVLKAIPPTHPYYLGDSSQLIRDLNSIGTIPTNGILFSIDVVSMYTVIPPAEMVDSIRRALAEKGELLWSERTLMPTANTEFVVAATELVLAHNQFQFDGHFYKQRKGIAMGTPAACVLTDIFICDYIQKLWSREVRQPMYYRQYRDDGIGLWQGTPRDLEEIVERMNESHPSIKFTLEVGGKKLSFLDLEIRIKDGKIETETYYKPTFSGHYLSWMSNHPPGCRRAIPAAQCLRHIRNSSRSVDYAYHRFRLSHNLRKQRYPEKVISRGIGVYQHRNRATHLKRTKRTAIDRVPLVTPYQRGMDVNWLVQRAARLSLTDAQLEKGGQPMVAYKVGPTLGSIITSARLEK
jgi:hypothetical protein